MTQSPSTKKQTTKQPPTTSQAALLLLLTIADTTWRTFVPTIGGTILGVMLDNLTHRAPLFTTTLIIVGFAVAILLVTLQIKRVRSHM